MDLFRVCQVEMGSICYPIRLQEKAGYWISWEFRWDSEHRLHTLSAQSPWEHLGAFAHTKETWQWNLPYRLWQKTCWPSNPKNPGGSAGSRSTINMKIQIPEGGSSSDAAWFKSSTEHAAVAAAEI